MQDKCNIHSKTMAVVFVDVSRVFTHKLLRSGYKLNYFTKYFEHRILIKQKSCGIILPEAKNFG